MQKREVGVPAAADLAAAHEESKDRLQTRLSKAHK
jgi:hypothetical protein